MDDPVPCGKLYKRPYHAYHAYHATPYEIRKSLSLFFFSSFLKTYEKSKKREKPHEGEDLQIQLGRLRDKRDKRGKREKS